MLLGLSTYLIGIVAMIGATILDGFVTPHIATGCNHRHRSRRSKLRLRILIYYIGVVLNDLAKLGWVLQAVGTLAWSVAMLHERGFNRAIGVLGLLSSALVVALIAASPTNMTMTSLLSVLFAQLIWNLAAAALLMRDPAPRRAILQAWNGMRWLRAIVATVDKGRRRCGAERFDDFHQFDPRGDGVALHPGRIRHATRSG